MMKQSAQLRSWCHGRTIPILVLLVCLLLSGCKCEQRIYSIHHDLGKGFHSRCKAIVLTADHPEITSAVEDRQDSTCDSSEEQSLLFQDLILNRKMYKIMIIDESTKTSAVTSVPACSLLRSNFREEISLVLGPKGELLSITYAPLISPLAPKSCSPSLVPTNLSFSTSVSYSTSTPAMTIPVLLPQIRPPPAGLKFFDTKTTRMEGLEGGPDTQNVSFLRKYWYIFLPMIIISLLGGGEEEERERREDRRVEPAAGASAGGSTGSGGVAASAAPASATQGVPSASGAAKRRGKRG